MENITVGSKVKFIIEALENCDWDSIEGKEKDYILKNQDKVYTVTKLFSYGEYGILLDDENLTNITFGHEELTLASDIPAKSPTVKEIVVGSKVKLNIDVLEAEGWDCIEECDKKVILENGKDKVYTISVVSNLTHIDYPFDIEEFPWSFKFKELILV